MAENQAVPRRPIHCPVCPSAPPLTHACTAAHGLNIFVCEACGSSLSVPTLPTTDGVKLKRKR
jgi:transposase-like protein